MLLRSWFVLILLSGIVACSFNNYNSTVYPYEFRQELAKKPARQVMISPINYDKPSRHYLTKYEASIDDSVKSFLKESRIKTVSNKSFISLWKKAQLDFGSTFNPSTGAQTSAFKPALESTLKTLFEQNPNLDAIIFTDLLEVSMQYGKHTQKSLSWHGIQRKIKVEGIGDIPTDDFNWLQMVDGISVAVYIFNRDLQLVHHSVGGIQVAQSLKINNKNARFGRRHDLLADEDDINEGIGLAFHPWIRMKNYPGKTID